MSAKTGSEAFARSLSVPMSQAKSADKNHSSTTPGAKSATVKEDKKSISPRSPRAPPLISKFRGEPPSPPHEGPVRSSKNNDKIFFASIGGAKPAPFYIIHPEWASEAEGIMRLGTRSDSEAPHRDTGRRKRRDAPKDSGREVQGGILPVDRGDESILATARRENAHNPVWPHRCKSSPAQRSRNPIAWA